MIWAASWFGLAAWLLTAPGKPQIRDEEKAGKRFSAMTVSVLLLGIVLLLLDVPIRWVTAVLGVLVTAIFLSRNWSIRKLRKTRNQEVIGACQALSSMVRTGMHPVLALKKVADDFEAFRISAHAAEIGARVDQALRETAEQPGYESLQELAAGWELSERTGAPLGSTALRIAGRLRGELSSQQKLEAELMSPRATGKLLAALPLVGILLGYVAGGDPVVFLFQTHGGQLALICAILLTCCGLLWTEWLAKEPD